MNLAMQRYFLEMQYNGKRYHGWQIQTNSPTVQSVINEKLSLLLKSNVETTGAGRTDTGVHARYFVAHFDLEHSIPGNNHSLLYKLNSFLPDDIRVIRICPVPDNAHARFDATSRTYSYYISTKKNVFQKDYVWYIYKTLDIKTMNLGANKLLEFEDFSSFSKLHSDVKNNNCKIFYSGWKKEDDLLIYTITANRFLRNMVRSIVGTMVLLGRQKIDLFELERIVESKNRANAGESAPANALFLEKIQYPYTFNEHI